MRGWSYYAGGAKTNLGVQREGGIFSGVQEGGGLTMEWGPEFFSGWQSVAGQDFFMEKGGARFIGCEKKGRKKIDNRPSQTGSPPTHNK